jgi:CheY-like chemotaxis protein
VVDIAPSFPVPVSTGGRTAPAPYLQRPGSVVFVDDNQDFLEAMAGAISPRQSALFFTHPRQVVEHLERQAPFAQADVWQHRSMISRWLDARVPLAPQLLQYWAAHTERFGLTRVVVTDGVMSNITGLELLDRISEYPCARVLLTGSDDARSAIAAFNDDRIDYFLTKQDTGLLNTLERIVERAACVPPDAVQGAWALCLAPAQEHAIQVAGGALRSALQARFNEYAIIGEPFGALGIGAGGCIGWLQFVEAKDGKLPARVGNQEVIGQLLGQSAASEASVEPISSDFGFAFFDLAAHTLSLPPITHFGAWQARQPRRRVQAASGD